MLWYFVVFLNFFISIVKLGEPNITVSYTIFLCCHFVFFLMDNFKTINNFSPKICYENAVDVKNKIIISNWDLPQLEIKNIVKRLWHFVVFLRFFFVWHFVVFVGFFFVWHFVVFLGFIFCLVKFGEPKFIFFRNNFLQLAFYFYFYFFKYTVKSG